MSAEDTLAAHKYPPRSSRIYVCRKTQKSLAGLSQFTVQQWVPLNFDTFNNQCNGFYWSHLFITVSWEHKQKLNFEKYFHFRHFVTFYLKSFRKQSQRLLFNNKVVIFRIDMTFHILPSIHPSHDFLSPFCHFVVFYLDRQNQ